MIYLVYLIYLPIAIVATIVLIKYLNKKNNEQRYRIIIILSILALLSHLIKPFFFPYTLYERPDILRKITFENICAVSALIYPIILVTKRKVLLDYMAVIGLLGGFLAFIYPTEVILGQFDSMDVTFKHGLFAFDTIRFFFVHYMLFIIPFLLLFYNIHQLKIKRAIYLPFMVMSVLLLIYLNEILLEQLGWLNEVHLYAGRNIFYDRNIRNSSFIFGIPESYGNLKWIVEIFVPKSFKTPSYIPVFWITIPIFIYAPLIYIGFYKGSNYVKNKFNNNTKNLTKA